MTSRIAGYSHWIGIALATPPLLLAIWLAAQETRYSWSPHPWDKDPIIEPVHNGRMWGTFTHEIALITLAVMIYAVSRVIGWVVGGSASLSKLK